MAYFNRMGKNIYGKVLFMWSASTVDESVDTTMVNFCNSISWIFLFKFERIFKQW